MGLRTARQSGLSGVAIFCGGGGFAGPHVSAFGCHAQACAGMLGDENHRDLPASMATPRRVLNISVSRRVAMAPRTLPPKMTTPGL